MATLVGLPQARGEILYDEEIDENTRVVDRVDTRSALGASGRAQATQPAYTQGAPSPVQIQPGTGPVQVQVTQASASSAAASESEVQHVGKAELMRRSRMREELKNEDILQERLEELRLRDEKARTNQILPQGGVAAATATAVAPAGMMTETVVVAPVTERPGQAAPEVLMANYRGQGRASTQVLDVKEEKEGTRFSITPRVGIAQMSNNTPFEVVPHYAAGISLGVEASENVGFEVGYQFNQYGIRFGQPVGVLPGWNTETHMLRQNVFDAALKLSLLDRSSTLRPYLLAGAAYSNAFLNYSPNQLAMIRMYYPQAARDYETTAFLGTLGAGLDVRVSRNISIGGAFKYNRVLSSRQAGNIYFVPAAYDPAKAIVGDQLALTNFYSIMAGATFSF
jgi:opacity protein-like surface antigen